MAAIDFPASPVDGQTFPAGNGVVYIYNGTQGIWVTLGQVTSPGADFWAMGSANGLAAFQILTPAVQVGNAGGYYNVSNGRWTPPAGRYYVWGGVNGGNAGQATQIVVQLRKNGTVFPFFVSQTPAALNWFGDPEMRAIVDMNGSDYIDLSASANAVLNNGAYCWIGAFPLSFPVTSPTIPGTLQLFSEQVAVGGETALEVTFPSGARKIELDLSLRATSNVDPAITGRLMQSGVPYTGSTYSWNVIFGSGGGPPGNAVSAGNASWGMSSGRQQAGTINLFPQITLGSMFGTFVQNLITTTTRFGQIWTYDCTITPSTVTGFRITTGSDSFSAGSYLRAFIAP